MSDLDVRWRQRLQNYQKAFIQLKNAAELKNKRALSDLEKQGLIKAFEFTHELAWNLLKDYLQYQGTINLAGSRDATREGFSSGLLIDGDNWMEMIKSRNQSAHTYDPKTADEIVATVCKTYLPLFESLNLKMSELVKVK